ncbi:MAG: hypothetical protein WBO57_07175, partial [Gammaproteobacteria bacterium]
MTGRCWFQGNFLSDTTGYAARRDYAPGAANWQPGVRAAGKKWGHSRLFALGKIRWVQIIWNVTIFSRPHELPVASLQHRVHSLVWR